MLKLLLVVAVLAVAVYLAVRLMDRRTLPPSPPRRPRRPLGPDDDPDFLRDLNRRRPRRPRREPDGDDQG